MRNRQCFWPGPVGGAGGGPPGPGQGGEFSHSFRMMVPMGGPRNRILKPEVQFPARLIYFTHVVRPIRVGGCYLQVPRARGTYSPSLSCYTAYV